MSVVCDNTKDTFVATCLSLYELSPEANCGSSSDQPDLI